MRSCLLALVLPVVLPAVLHAQPDPASVLRWRNIGPNRGGRSIAVAGSSARPFEYYFGATGGGLWKTTDGGTSWAPVTDGLLASSSVGAVAVAPSNPDVVYVGMGETQLRGNVMQGDGLYRSTDGGRTWTHAGLRGTQAIGRVRVDPADPDRVYVAALGDPFGPSDERGVYRTTDGGRTWQRVLHRGPSAGAVDLIIDPNDSQVLYATTWQVYRTPWLLWSGGEGSGLFKSVDGGTTWTNLTRNPGLPTGVLGKVTIAVSGAASRRLYANIEAREGGLHRSDDGGATWIRVNAHRDLWQRAFYFLRVVADPRDLETVYVLSFQLERSTDGGRTFAPLRTTHADHHDLWIDPNNPQRLVEANDGGASVSVNGGRTWTSQDYPTAQIYRVTTTPEYPYHVCGAQQDNTTVCVPSRGEGLAPPGSRAGQWFYAVGGGESADIAVHPGRPDIFYAGSTNTLTRFDRRTGDARDIQPHPRIVMGEPASAMPERWNWTYPLAVTARDPRALYAGSQHLWKTRNEGRTWRRISPDLTRADSATMGNSGGPIVFDQDGPEIYATLFTIAPSPRDTSVIWTGSDDGLVHVTRDGGRSWRQVTPPALAPNSRVSRIDASAHNTGTAWVAVERHQMSDRRPYAWRTRDFGATWTPITQGLPEGAFVRVIREDPVVPGLLFAGTEHGVFVSDDAGDRWRSLSLNLPDLQVSDLVVHGHDAVIASHGRSFWILDDITPLRHSARVRGGRAALLPPAAAYRRLEDARIDYVLPPGSDSVKLRIEAAGGAPVRTLATPSTAGVHRARWDLTYPGAQSFPGIVLEGGDPARGVLAPPGRYRVRLTVFGADGRSDDAQWLEVRQDPRIRGVSAADLQAQFTLLMQVRDAESEANGTVRQIRETRDAMRQRLGAAADSSTLLRTLGAIEGELYQVRNQSPKDKIAFPIKLNDRLTGLRAIIETGDARPTEAQRRVYRQLRSELDGLLMRVRAALRTAA
jgi:photosystem II stability/assembly factor-like uncharacterized protein